MKQTAQLELCDKGYFTEILTALHLFSEISLTCQLLQCGVPEEVLHQHPFTSCFPLLSCMTLCNFRRWKIQF